MIATLHIKNIGIIEDLSIELNNGLILDTDVDSWKLSKRDIDELKKWVIYQLNHNT